MEEMASSQRTDSHHHRQPLPKGIGMPQQKITERGQSSTTTQGPPGADGARSQERPQPSNAHGPPSVDDQPRAPFSAAGGGSQDAQRRLAEVSEAVQADWEQREFANAARTGVLRMTEFLHTFELTTRSKIATLDARLTSLERQLEALEQQIRSSRNSDNKN